MNTLCLLATITVLFPAIRKIETQTIIHTCPSPVYCQGDLLHTVQMAKIYNDSKRFVDMSMTYTENRTLNDFEEFMTKYNSSPTKSEIKEFVESHFVLEGELEKWEPPDYKNEPGFLNNITENKFKKFSASLIKIWKKLGRKVKDSIRSDPSRFSLISVPHGFIIPGGRFIEIYYWDTYWTIKGLLLCEMKETTKGMLLNFAHMINTYGFIPNGSRVYYLNRSQPPFFAMMVDIYFQRTKDKDFLTKNIDAVEKEVLFWIDNRVVEVEKNGVKYQMAHYAPESNTPRPESYYEDVNECKNFSTDVEKATCYNNMKAGAESGMDFSTRWGFVSQGDIAENFSLVHMQVNRVIPVDLNGILYRSCAVLAKFYGELGNSGKKKKWQEYADQWLKSIEDVLYDKNDGIWYDYDMVNNESRKTYYISNFVPLYTEAYDGSKKNEYGKKAAQYFNKQGLNNYHGGIPTSFIESGQQWDYPNAWAPYNEMAILGLYKTENKDAQKIAKTCADNWIKACEKGFSESGTMYEKYDARYPGVYGGGGEYAVQDGFGWTNGVVLTLIEKFYRKSAAQSIKPSLKLLQYGFAFALLPFLQNLVNL